MNTKERLQSLEEEVFKIYEKLIVINLKDTEQAEHLFVQRVKIHWKCLNAYVQVLIRDIEQVKKHYCIYDPCPFQTIQPSELNRHLENCHADKVRGI